MGRMLGSQQYHSHLSSNKFPAHFLDPLSSAVIDDQPSVLDWCQFMFTLNPVYRQAVMRCVAYFQTDVAFTSGTDKLLGDDEESKYDEFFRDQLNIQGQEMQMGMDMMCFHGDVKAVTRDGVYKLRDLAGQTVDVLSEGGVYRPAKFKSFGRQRLLEVEFSDGRTILATPEHKWVVRNCSGKTVRIPTTELRKNHRIERTVAPRPEKNADYAEGVRHGFAFGDGSLYNDGKQCCVPFFGAKETDMVPWYEGHGSEPRQYQTSAACKTFAKIHGLPAHYKEMPAATASASYWYGFICGLLAADGSVDTYGCALLTQKARAALEISAEQLPRIGMAAGPVRGHMRTAEFIRDDGTVDTYTGLMHYVTLLKRFMQADDFVRPHHRRNFEENYQPTNYGKYIAIKDVRETGMVDEVFCCVEMETHTFVVDQAILTGQCYGNHFCSIVDAFKWMIQCRCGNQVTLREASTNPRYRWRWMNMTPHADCPNCHHNGAWKMQHYPDDRPESLKFRSWAPQEIEIDHDLLTGNTKYKWRIPQDYAQQIRSGKVWQLENCRPEVFKAIACNDRFLEFDHGKLFHAKEPTLSGHNLRGWGCSRTMMNFRPLWKIQVLHRHDETFCLDYIIPFRVVTPDGGRGGEANEPFRTANMGTFKRMFDRMNRLRRFNPTDWHAFPYPIKYQLLGGDARQLMTPDMLDGEYGRLLDGIGAPVELQRGTLDVQSLPTSLRVFEASFSFLTHTNNEFLRWTANEVSRRLRWQYVVPRHHRVQHADDMQKMMAILQMAAGGNVSLRTALRMLGLNNRDEKRYTLEDQRWEQTFTSRMQEEMAQSDFMQQLNKGTSPMTQAMSGQAGGQAPPGGAPPAGAPAPAGGAPMGGGDPADAMIQQAKFTTDPSELMAISQQFAQYLMKANPSVRNQAMSKAEQQSPLLHAAAKQMIAKQKQQFEAQGREQGMMENYGQPA